MGGDERSRGGLIAGCSASLDLERGRYHGTALDAAPSASPVAGVAAVVEPARRRNPPSATLGASPEPEPEGSARWASTYSMRSFSNESAPRPQRSSAECG